MHLFPSSCFSKAPAALRRTPVAAAALAGLGLALLAAPPALAQTAAGIAQAPAASVGPAAAAANSANSAISAISADAAGASAWQACTALQGDAAARLACFDGWAGQQATRAGGTAASAAVHAAGTGTGTGTGANTGTGAASTAALARLAPPAPAPAVLQVVEVPRTTGCRDAQFSALSRFWELEDGTDCGTFSFRGYRPINVSVTVADTVNRLPTSSVADHSALDAIDYRTVENRIQLSVRTKVAQGLLTGGDSPRKDSLWVGYTQQSYWQVFSPDISRPFRATDHEPEVMYVYPTDFRLPLGWRLRYSGIGLAHQSNGQSLPLSRSWNRTYLMAGMELGDRWTVQAKVWKRINEGARNDDNPDITDYLGRGELTTLWNANPDHTLALTLRHSLKQHTRGSARLEWLQTLGKGFGGGKSNLRLHTQLFTGYGDSLIDYNRKRTVLSVGLSLVDF